jgi:hypothetical protein
VTAGQLAAIFLGSKDQGVEDKDHGDEDGSLANPLATEIENALPEDPEGRFPL